MSSRGAGGEPGMTWWMIEATETFSGSEKPSPGRAHFALKPYSIVGASFFTLCTSSPSQAAFLAVPSKVALVLNSSYLPSSA